MNRAKSLFIWLLPAVSLFSIIFLSNAWGDRINFRGEFTHTNSDTETTNKSTGQVFTGETSQFDQQYNFDFSKTVYPYLTLAGGTLYELNNSTSTFQGIETEAEETILRPYANLNLNNPLYRAGVGYRRAQIENEATGTPVTQDFRDEFNTFLGWRPSGLPELNLHYSYTNIYDDPKTVDSIQKLLTFGSRYTLWQKLGLKYAYSRTENENKIDMLETLTQNHNGKIDYSQNFFNRRLSLSTGYRIRYTTFEFPGDVELQLGSDAGLYDDDNSPAEELNNEFGKLIDENKEDSADIDIGSGGSTAPTIGLQLTFTSDVNKIYIWVQKNPPLSEAIANTFPWSVYTSRDNNDSSIWDPVLNASASFESSEDRFVITFSEVNTEFIKVVTSPPAGAPAQIFVTEMQAFTTVSGVAGENEITNIDQDYNLNLSGKLGDKATLGYNLFYRLQERNPSSAERTELSNGLSFDYVFNRVFSAGASFSQTDRTLTDQQNVSEKSTSNTYAASLRAAYWEALRQILTYSGTKITAEEGSSSSNSLFLRTNADLYRGWSAFFDAGYSWNEPLDDAETTSTIIRTGTNIVPNNKVTININYSINQTQQSGRDTSRSELDFQAFVIPFRALSFNARASIVDREDSTATLYNYSANWSPFPDGTLQFFLTYVETLRPEEEQKSRTIGPNLKWTISRHFSLDMAYAINENETRLQATESNSYRMKLRITF